MTKTSTKALSLRSSKLLWIQGFEKLNSLLRSASVAAILFYKGTWSYIIGPCCRFYPTCSEYSKIAYQQHPFLKATYLTAKRILRCHPFGGSGYDPVCGVGTTTEMNKGIKT